MNKLKLIFSVTLLFTCVLSYAERPKLEDLRYEDNYTFKHGKSYTMDPYVWGYTREFAERFRMPEQWIEPQLKGALAIAFRMTTIGNTTCGLGGRADNCWKPLDCQMDVYYDSRIQLPWNFPEIMRDNIVQGLSSSQYLHFTPDSRIRRYVRKDQSKPSGIMNAGAGLVYGKYNQGGSQIVYYDREYEAGVALISYVGPGVCPEYKGAEQVYMPFESREDFEKYRHGKLREKDIRIVHRIDFPRTYLERARPVYEQGNKPNEQTMDRLTRKFFDSRKGNANAAPKP